MRQFYGDLFAGLDVRAALHRTRKDLYEHQNEAGHDWVSLVGYVQLPEGYRDHLEDVRLKSQLAALKNLRDRAEAAGKSGAEREELESVRADLEERIAALEKTLATTTDPK